MLLALDILETGVTANLSLEVLFIRGRMLDLDKELDFSFLTLLPSLLDLWVFWG